MTDQLDSPQTDAEPATGGSEIKKLGFSLYLKIPDTRLECRCSYIPHNQGSMITRDELLTYLKQYNVREGIDQEAFDDFLVKAAAGKQQVNVLLVAGTPPVAGEDECIALSVNSSAAVHAGEEVSTDVDMHIVQTFVNVATGEEIGRIIPAGAGTPGRDITGMTIAPQAGKPLKVTIGKNIRTEENGTLLIAAATGRFCQSAGEISVEEEYIVKGDVNFRVGSIDFKGVTEVRGDVLDNFDVTSTKGITVTGNIGACNIISDGDIAFCGMDGQERGRIVCGGTLRAHFIHDAVVECAGDVIVDVEIHNCTIRTLGRIVADKGAISGGSYIALGGIEARKLGSGASVHTRLHAGADYRVVGQLEQLFAELTDLQNKAKEPHTPSEAAEIQRACADLTVSILAIRDTTDPSANAKINAKAVLYENVQLTLGDTTEMIHEQKDGAFSVIENSIEGGLRYLSMTGLNVKATDIEQAFMREHKLSLRKVTV